MKRPANLKQRLNELREQPEAPLALTLHLDAELYRALSLLAAPRGQSLETYLVNVLKAHAEAAAE